MAEITLTKRKLLIGENVKIVDMPKCALCDNQSWRWVRDFSESPAIEVALCDKHAPMDGIGYTVTSIACVRHLLLDQV